MEKLRPPKNLSRNTEYNTTPRVLRRMDRGYRPLLTVERTHIVRVESRVFIMKRFVNVVIPSLHRKVIMTRRMVHDRHDRKSSSRSFALNGVGYLNYYLLRSVGCAVYGVGIGVEFMVVYSFVRPPRRW